jgi:histidinol-phosphate/aromatic aminotransferase/cobyric acid decarboxylase-like protein
MVDRPEPPRVHGGIDRSELERHGLDETAVLDLSVNVNPFGPHPDVARAVAAANLAEYPDRTARRARLAIAAAIDCDPGRILLGHGSVELLWAIISELRRSANGKPLLIVGPTFGEPEAAARAHGVPCAHVDMLEADDYAFDRSRIETAIAASAAAAVYLCLPNNPTGRNLGSSELQGLIERYPGVQFIVDQAFLSLSTGHAQAGLRFERHPNVIVVRSLTKDHALAGLRIGYALASAAWLARIDTQRPPWMVSALAQAAVLEAMRHPEHVTAARDRLLAARLQLSASVARLGFGAVTSETHYFLIRVDDADALRERLLIQQRVLVRSCRSFGLPHHIRVAAGDEIASQRLLRGLADQAREPASRRPKP